MSDDDFYMIIAGLEVDSASDDDDSGDEPSGEWGAAALIVVVALTFVALFWLLV